MVAAGFGKKEKLAMVENLQALTTIKEQQESFKSALNRLQQVQPAEKDTVVPVSSTKQKKNGKTTCRGLIIT